MKILHVVASLRASYGGPARSVPALSRAMKQLGCDSVVWAADGSGEGDGALPGFDLVHDHGIWLPHNWRVARVSSRRGIPRVVSPRGMLEPWALAHKRWKKQIAWWLYQRRALRSASVLHATSSAEKAGIERLGLGVPVCMVPNGVDLPEQVPQKEVSPCGRRTVLFLGRIYPVKGLPLLVEAWNRLRPPGWRLEIAGPDEAGHRSEVEKLVCQHGLQHEIIFTGPVEGAGKSRAFARAELLVLPSYSENFGMAAAEALAHGLPVIATKGTPWSVLEPRGCGWWVDPTVEGIAEGLSQAVALSPPSLREMGLRGREMVAREFSWGAAGAAMLDIYRGAIDGKK